MKRLCLLVFLHISLNVAAQGKIPLVRSNSLCTADVIKVASDYYDHFYHIIGDKIGETESTIEFKSKVLPQGAEESTIIQIKSLQNVFSWQAVMMNIDDYDKAVARYRQIYRQLDGASLTMNDGKKCRMKGSYDAPDNDRGFASSILQPDVNEKYLQRLKIEVALNYNMPEWTVKVMVYEKEADEDIRPSETIVQ
jgi:hypothetical protein